MPACHGATGVLSSQMTRVLNSQMTRVLNSSLTTRERVVCLRDQGFGIKADTAAR